MIGIRPEIGLKLDSTIEEKALGSTVRLDVSCTCWIAAVRLVYNVVPLRIILLFGWLVMQTAKEDAGLVAVNCVLLRCSRLSGSWEGQTVVLVVGLMIMVSSVAG